MKRSVADTGPILHLLEIDALPILRAVATVSIPRAVDGELLSVWPAWSTTRPDWLTVVELEPVPAAAADRWLRGGLLHEGEAAALALTRQLGADWFLTDDALARVMAQTLGIEAHGTMGIVFAAAALGRVDGPSARRMLDALGRSLLWVSATVLAQARTALEELLRR